MRRRPVDDARRRSRLIRNQFRNLYSSPGWPAFAGHDKFFLSMTYIVEIPLSLHALTHNPHALIQASRTGRIITGMEMLTLSPAQTPRIVAEAMARAPRRRPTLRQAQGEGHNSPLMLSPSSRACRGTKHEGHDYAPGGTPSPKVENNYVAEAPKRKAGAPQGNCNALQNRQAHGRYREPFARMCGRSLCARAFHLLLRRPRTPNPATPPNP